MNFIEWCGCGCSDNFAALTQSQRKTRLLWIILVLLTVFFIVEWSIGLWSQSLSLQADAGHMFSDIAALAISLVGSLLAQRPANHKATFGYRRLETLAALANSLGLIFLAGFIIWESIQRWQSPQNIMGLPMLVTAVLGLIVNLFNITLLHPHSHNDLNLRGAMLHMISDTVSSVGVILAALAVHLFNWLWADVAVSLLVGTITGISAFPLLKESLKIFLEYAPESIDITEVKNLLLTNALVLEVDKLRVWKIDSTQVMLCADLTVECQTVDERDYLLKKLHSTLNRSFGITEISLQLTSRKSQTVKSLHPLFEQNLVSLVTGK